MNIGKSMIGKPSIRKKNNLNESLNSSSISQMNAD